MIRAAEHCVTRSTITTPTGCGNWRISVSSLRHPGIIRRVGVISMNTALEMDIYGNVNSSHVFGTHVVNGVGGSGEFTRNNWILLVLNWLL